MLLFGFQPCRFLKLFERHVTSVRLGLGKTRKLFTVYVSFSRKVKVLKKYEEMVKKFAYLRISSSKIAEKTRYAERCVLKKKGIETSCFL
jgi:hypothetical protein